MAKAIPFLEIWNKVIFLFMSIYERASVTFLDCFILCPYLTKNGSLCSPYIFASLLFSPYLVLETRRRCPLSKARRSITRRVVNKQTPPATTHFSFDPFFLSFHKTNKQRRKIMIWILPTNKPVSENGISRLRYAPPAPKCRGHLPLPKQIDFCLWF